LASVSGKTTQRADIETRVLATDRTAFSCEKKMHSHVA